MRFAGGLRRLVGLALLASLLGLFAVHGVERFPPPDFDAGYKFPTTTAPVAKAQWKQFLDVFVLFAALSVASYLVLKKRSRAWVLGLTVFSVLYFGFYREGCVCPIGSTQNVAMALFQPGYAVPWPVLVFFLLPLVFTLFFGRTFCAAVCPLGSLQDLAVVKPKTLPLWLERGLSVVPFVYLGAGVLFAATGSAFLFCEYDPFIALYRRSGSLFMVGFGLLFIVLGTVVGRPYCRFLCPYGALLSVLSRFSRWNVTLTPEDCINCQLCEVACPYGAIKEPTGALSPASEEKRKRRLAIWLVLLPVLILLGAWLGRQMATPFSKLHATVALAEQVAAEDSGTIKVTTDASNAFRESGKPKAQLVAQALQIRKQFGLGATVFGAFVGLVIGLKMVGLNRHELVPRFEPEHANCVACARCYTHCPNELLRLKREQKAKAIPLTAA